MESQQAQFEPERFFQRDLTRTDWIRLTKPQLIQIAKCQDIEMDIGLKKMDMVDFIIDALGLDSYASQDKKTQLELAEIQSRTQLELAKLEQQTKLDLAKLDLERAKSQASENQRQRSHENRFNFSDCLKLMPKFNTTEVEVFFDAFEKIARELEWPEDKWAILVQTSFVGKAQEAYATLDPVNSTDYTQVKQAVLLAYEVVPEFHRQRFRSLRRKAGESYLDLVRHQEAAFERWVKGAEVFTYNELKELILLEQFKNSLPRHIEVHLNDKEVINVRKAGIMADSFELVHREPVGMKDRPGGGKATPVEYVSSGDRFVSKPHRSAPGVVKSITEVKEIVCHYCKKVGHMKSRCPVLERKTSFQFKSFKPDLCVMSAPEESLNSVESVEATSALYKGFLSVGTVSVSQGEQEVPVNILRDTGASQSVLLSGVMDLPESSSLKSSVLLKGVGGEFQTIPLYQLYLKSDLVCGEVILGVVPTLPVGGVQLLLGNDLAFDRVWANPVISNTPCEAPETHALEAEYPAVFSACVVTRSQAREKSVYSDSVCKSSVNLGETQLGKLLRGFNDLSFSRDKLIAEQQSDPVLAVYMETAASLEEIRYMAGGFYLENGVLMRKWRPPTRPATEDWCVLAQVVLPACFREEVLRLAHEVPMSGHLGIRKTQEKVLRHFFWPKLHRDVVEFCRSCHVCQVVGKPNQVIPVAPLHPLPVVSEPFSRVLIDCVGPLPKTKKGNEYLLTIMDVTTRFPEAVPLRNIKAKTIVEVLLQFFCRVGLPRELQSDRGSNFTSGVFQEVMSELGIVQVASSAYHPQSQGAIERYHQTLKTMMRTYCAQWPGDWDTAMPFLLFAIRDSVNDSLGFSPFELVYGHEIRGPLKIMKESFLEPEGKGNLLQYVASFKDRLQSACELAQANLVKAQECMKKQFDRKAVTRTFAVGDRVLVLMPMRGEGLGTRFCGPYPIVKKVSETNYVVKTPDRRRSTQLCHVNLLKPYYARSSAETVCCVSAYSLPLDRVEGGEEEGSKGRELVSAHLHNSVVLEDLDSVLTHLKSSQQADMKALIHRHLSLFQDKPGRTSVIVHDVDTGTVPPIKQHPYRVHPHKSFLMKKELSYMIDIGAIEPAQSEWSSPVVLIPKPDGSVRFCIDFRKVNSVTRTDAFPIPRLEDCIDQIGKAQFVTKLDLLKGYWQVPLSDHAKTVSAFVTSHGLYRCLVLPFGMKNAPASFQRLMNQVTVGLDNVVTYIDDLVAYSFSWADHLVHLGQLFERLEEAGLVVNLPKCELGKGQVTYLGHRVGHGEVLPKAAKIQAILDFPVPQTRRQLMRVLGMCGFYRKFVPNFAAITAPLTNLLRKGVKFSWSEKCQEAFGQVKAILACEPILTAPDFAAPFKMAVDACDVGVGAVLLQSDESGVDRPVAYFSRKLNDHQKAYSTIEKEALGLVLAVQHFEVYLSGGGDVTVYTDHNPLTFLEKFRGSNQRVFRWSLALQPYNLVVRHVAGRENVIADTLSRGACD